jgi:hypothetical protein
VKRILLEQVLEEVLLEFEVAMMLGLASVSARGGTFGVGLLLERAIAKYTE